MASVGATAESTQWFTRYWYNPLNGSTACIPILLQCKIEFCRLMVRYAYRINFNCTKLWNRWADSSVQTIGMILFHCAPISRVHCMPDWWVRLFLGQKVVALARAGGRHPALLPPALLIHWWKKEASKCFVLQASLTSPLASQQLVQRNPLTDSLTSSNKSWTS